MSRSSFARGTRVGPLTAPRERAIRLLHPRPGTALPIQDDSAVRKTLPHTIHTRR